MPNELTRVSREDVLPAPLNRQETDKIERHAIDLYTQAERTTVQFAAELRRLQDGGAHLIRGFPNFGDYAEASFPGLAANTAQQLSRQGGVLLALEGAKKISLAGKGKNLPGARAVRALATIQKTFGDEAMIRIYDEALATGRGVTAETVTAAAGRLVASAPAAELGPGVDDAPTVDPDEDEDEDEDETLPGKMSERIDHIRDLAYDLPETAKEMQDELTNLQREASGDTIPEDEAWLSKGR